MSPTARTLKHLRERGSIVQVVERWNAHARRRVDLFGIIDIIALHDGAIVGIQATSRSNHSARVQKSLAEPRLVEWLKCGGKYQVASWGKLRGRWTLRVDSIVLRGDTPIVEEP